MNQLVSVVVVTYNSAHLLPWCLASICAQTWHELECLVIDDGSTDGTRELVSRTKDPRIKYFRHPRNRGRAAARQTGLERAAGEFICSVDADDWIAPSRVQNQLAFMKSHPEVAICSGGMALVDSQNQLSGVRCLPGEAAARQVQAPLRSLRRPPIAHGPCMIQTSVARKYRYRQFMKLAQDIDFLTSILLEHRWAVLPTVDYCYRESDSTSLGKIVSSHLYWIRSLWSRLPRYPLGGLREMMVSLLKVLIYPPMFLLKGKEGVMSYRSRPAPAEVRREFRRSREVVARKVAELFGDVATHSPEHENDSLESFQLR